MSEITGKELRNLSEDELTPVSGGVKDPDEVFFVPIGFCERCKDYVPVNEFSGFRYKCQICGTQIEEKDVIH